MARLVCLAWSCAVASRVHEAGNSLGAPGGLDRLVTGRVGEPLVASLVPPSGSTYTFKVAQYKDKPHHQMEYDWMLHKVNNEEVNQRFASSQGSNVFRGTAKGTFSSKAWLLRRRFGAARFFAGMVLGGQGAHVVDSLYFLKASHGGGKSERESGSKGATQKMWKDSLFTIRRIGASIPQRWTVHSGFTMGGTAGTAKSKQYDATRKYWIRGHKGTYNAFKTPEDSAVWHCSNDLKNHCSGGRQGVDKQVAEKLRLASFSKKVENGRMTHTVIVKSGVDSAVMLTMLSVFRWEHYVGVATILMPAAQYRGDYQPDAGIMHSYNKGRRPSLLEEEANEDSEMDETGPSDGLDDAEYAEFLEQREE